MNNILLDRQRRPAYIPFVVNRAGVSTMGHRLEKPFILTYLTGRTPVDIIYPSDEQDYNYIISQLIAKHIGFDRLTEEDGIKLLLAYGGVGAGCYITTDADKAYRSVEAKLQYIDLSNHLGFIRISEPTAFLAPVPNNQRMVA